MASSLQHQCYTDSLLFFVSFLLLPTSLNGLQMHVCFLLSPFENVSFLWERWCIEHNEIQNTLKVLTVFAFFVLLLCKMTNIPLLAC